MPKHTPGPWIVGSEFSDIQNSDRGIIAGSEFVAATFHDYRQGHKMPGDGEISDEQEAANARLIAAAPELAKVAAMVVRASMDAAYPFSDILSASRAALKKAGIE